MIDNQSESNESQADSISFSCANCGANLRFIAGTSMMRCNYCSHETAVPESLMPVEENNYAQMLVSLEKAAQVVEQVSIDCQQCGAVIEKLDRQLALTCPYCDSPMVSKGKTSSHIQTDAVLPFAINAKQAIPIFKRWLKSLWFAPNALKKYAKHTQKLNGMYTPYWTYDSDTLSSYTGQRGEDYYVTVTTTDHNGNRSFRRERRTRWYTACGRVNVDFNDVLILASTSLPEKYANALTPWDLDELKPYRDAYLSGYQAEHYQIGLRQGFDQAKNVMDEDIRNAIGRDIGGDRQRISTVHTRYDNIHYKSILLPVWVSAYRYKDKVYRFLINARTGEVQGERPWSYMKIAGAVLGIVALIGGVYYRFNA